MKGKRHIKFSKCPIEPHKGERWEKLEKVDTSKPVVLDDILFSWSSDFWKAGGPSDTFLDWKQSDWEELVRVFYGMTFVYGLVLYFKQGDYYFTTFRAYDYRKHNYYSSHIGDEFWIKEEK